PRLLRPVLRQANAAFAADVRGRALGHGGGVRRSAPAARTRRPQRGHQGGGAVRGELALRRGVPGLHVLGRQEPRTALLVAVRGGAVLPRLAGAAPARGPVAPATLRGRDAPAA